jgi:hypothetical protein
MPELRDPFNSWFLASMAGLIVCLWAVMAVTR